MLTGNSIKLRAIEPKDLDLMYHWENDTTIWNVSGTISPFSKYTLEEYIKTCQSDIYSNRQLRFAIDLNDSSKTIGYIDLFEFDPQHRRAGVGILIGDQAERKKSFAKESLSLLIDYAFNTLNLHQLYCNIPETNHASLRLFSSSGFKEAGILKDWIMNHGDWQQVIVMQLINETETEE
ncbi:MAG: GNAT family N-acetyltransferase [Bacteroidia bacterium]